jgi:hypothetical protein
MRRVSVRIAPDGKVKVETEGYTGQSCLEATRLLEQALGFTGDESREMKPESFEENDNLLA